ncbi:hypothetical protein [Pseudoclavibacter sp. 8L]|uniref:hypothetical protein n=1 Tax=Pseudoclavibacter sp. 8L TaxID=2653162 RepID=UPI0012EFD39D|nr:hypothetical protein [Pseudoclavibacter sp. 8L]VXC31803.1 conserved exported hypothetical protein [Pseudoclavibacter sp. 8L]
MTGFQAPTCRRRSAVTAVALLCVAVLAGCSPAGTPSESTAPTATVVPGAYLEEFELEVARTATDEDLGLLVRGGQTRMHAAALNDDGQSFRLVRLDFAGDTCSEAPTRLMLLDSTTILITYERIVPYTSCLTSGTTRVDEFRVPPGVEPVGLEVRTTNTHSASQPLTFEAPSVTATTGAVSSSTALADVPSRLATDEESALMTGDKTIPRHPKVVASDSTTFTIARFDALEPCNSVPSELIVLSSTEISVNYRSFSREGGYSDCVPGSVDLAEQFEIPASVAGSVTVSITEETPKAKPIYIEPSTV